MRGFLTVCALVISALAHGKLSYQGPSGAKGAILINADTGAILYERNAHAPLYPSSTTKVMTALYALQERGGYLDDMVTASREAVSIVSPQVRRVANSVHPPHRLEYGGTSMGLMAGEILSLRALFYGLMLPSGNDASNVIAEYVSGSIPRFMEELNRYLVKIGCRNTHLCAPHGLPHPEHRTTAFDMGLATLHALKIPFFCEVVKSDRFMRPQTNLQMEKVLPQHNALIRKGQFHYPKAIGVKTGYTTSGGYSLVAAAENGQRRLISVVLSSETSEQRFAEAIALFETAFNEKKVSRTLFSKGFDLFHCQMEGAKAPLQACLEEDVALEYYPSEEPVFQSVVHWEPFSLPIAVGQKVGEVHICTEKGEKLASTGLYAVRDVEATLYHRFQGAALQTKVLLSQYVALILAFLGAAFLFVSFKFAHRSKRGI